MPTGLIELSYSYYSSLTYHTGTLLDRWSSRCLCNSSLPI